MICPPCARAADQRLGRDAHCDDDKCMCGHDTDKYGQTTAAPTGLYEQVIAMFGGPLPPYRPPLKGSCACGGGDFDGESIHAPGCPVRPARLRAIEAQLDALLPEQAREAGIHFAFGTGAEQCHAEFHHPTMQSARCDLPAGHPQLHREQPDPERSAFRWDDSVAMYPTTTED